MRLAYLADEDFYEGTIVLKFICRHWYNIGLTVAIGTIVALVLFWQSFDVLRRVQIMSFIAMLIHQFEEYGFPGGEPAITNMVMRTSDIPDRYPLNQFSAMLTNVLITYVAYLLPVFFPHVVWLCLAPILMGFAQVLVHGILTNIKMKTIYNPGFGAVIFLHVPVGIYYIHYIAVNRMVDASNLIGGIIYFVLSVGLVVNGLTYKVLPNRNTKYVFSEEEMQRFHVKEKLEKNGR